MARLNRAKKSCHSVCLVRPIDIEAAARLNLKVCNKGCPGCRNCIFCPDAGTAGKTHDRVNSMAMSIRQEQRQPLALPS